ncbi:MAG: hypothetical protein K6U12_12795 [Armatimonadetes bacterium]|nr:hypothetical protein [Armatimonadota bacterium]
MGTHYYLWQEALGHEIDWDWEERVRAPRIALPLVKCPACAAYYTGNPWFSIPEPVPSSLRQLLWRWEQRLRERKTHPVELVPMLPHEFADLAQQVRRTYGFPPERRIVPGTDLGSLYLFSKDFRPAWHIYSSSQVSRVLFTGSAKQLVERLRTPYFLWFPVLYRKDEPHPAGLWQVVFIGQCVLPHLDAGQWVQCPECFGWDIKASGVEDIGFAVPAHAEKEDFIYLEGVGMVVSERVAESLQSLGEHALWRVEFIPLARRRRRVAPLSPEESQRLQREAEESFEELLRSLKPPFPLE